MKGREQMKRRERRDEEKLHNHKSFQKSAPMTATADMSRLVNTIVRM